MVILEPKYAKKQFVSLCFSLFRKSSFSVRPSVRPSSSVVVRRLDRRPSVVVVRPSSDPGSDRGDRVAIQRSTTTLVMLSDSVSTLALAAQEFLDGKFCQLAFRSTVSLTE